MTAHSDRNDHRRTSTGPLATSEPLPLPSPNPPSQLSLGLLDDADIGHQATDSKDVAILRRLKLAILEGQHPYFKANVDLSNLQDLVLTASASRVTNFIRQPELSKKTALAESTSAFPKDGTPPFANAVHHSPIAKVVNGHSKHNKSEAETSLDQRLHDFEMNNVEPNESRMSPKDFGADIPRGPASEKNLDSNNIQPGSSYILGRHTLMSPIERESASDASTVIDIIHQNAEPGINIKRESPPYQLSGSQLIDADLNSSSMSSFASAATTSTTLTSESGTTGTDASGRTDDGNADLSGYNPKYGNKADYLRHQKVRVKMIESIEEKSRRLRPRSEERSQHKSPPRQTDDLPDRETGPQDSPAREPEYVPRNHTMPPPLRAPSLHARGVSPNGLRRTPSIDMGKERLPPPPSVHQSPRVSRTTSFSRTASPPPGRYIPPQRPREYSPPRDVRPQYLPYDEPRSAPARPRPVVSSPPRGSPPREPSAPRVVDRQALENYSSSFPRNEARSFDLRPTSSSSVFPDRPRDGGSFSMDREDTWSHSARGLPRAPLPRDSPPRHGAPRERTSFGSSSLPANPSAGYRPQTAPDPPSTARYTPYDTSVRRPDGAWPSHDWDASRPAENKPKLLDRFAIEPTWPRNERDPRDEYVPRSDRERDRDRDDFGPRSRERDGFRREPSPGYADGLRSGFRRPSDIEGMRPMKRSRPDDGYDPRSGPGPERGRYDLDARPPVGEYYPREPVRRPDDEYIPRTRPPYNSWNGGPP